MTFITKIHKSISRTIAFPIKQYIERKVTQSLPLGVSLHTNYYSDEKTCDMQVKEFELRYKVMVKNKGESNPFPENHYCIHGNQFHDPCDFYSSTAHLNIMKDGQLLGTTRLVNGNDQLLEMESFDWYRLRDKHPEIGNNIIEPSRVVACPSIKGGPIIPLLYLHSSLYCINHGIGSIIGMFNYKSIQLMRHYKKWTKFDMIVDEPFHTEEFIKGNKCMICKLSITDSTGDASMFVLTNLLPSYILYRYKTIQYNLQKGIKSIIIGLIFNIHYKNK